QVEPFVGQLDAVVFLIDDKIEIVRYKVHVAHVVLHVKLFGLEGIDPHLEGTTAFAFSAEDAVAPAKVICDYIKKNKLDDKGILSVKVGTVEGKVIEAKEVQALASLPSREQLIAKLMGSMNAPISNTVNVLQGVIRNAVYVLDAVRAQKASA
ncbi:MAG: 50S ribosomal protein L10, partial [Selenomonas massiliensis]